MQELTQYNAMRVAVQNCATIDEASDIRDKAAALAAYAKQRDDAELQQWVSEIKLRACQRIGQISLELDKAERIGAPGGYKLPSGGKSKADALADAGISTSTAARYEELAGGREKQAQAIGSAAADTFFASARAAGDVPTMDGLRTAVRGALEESFGKPEPRPQRAKLEPPSQINVQWLDFVGAVKEVADLPGDLAALAAHAGDLADIHLDEARRAVVRLREWIACLKEADNARREKASA